MATLVGTQKELGAMLNRLIEMELDAVAAYTAAVDKLQTPSYKQQISGFLGDHKSHITALKSYAAKLSLDMAGRVDGPQRTQARKMLPAQTTEERAILQAMARIEDDTNGAYEQAIAHEDASPDLMAIFEQSFTDERRHRAWLAGCLNPKETRQELSESIARDKAGTGNFQDISLQPKI